ncbi:MAG: ATP-binding protein [Nitriliruptorales bacterium]|nr:ATP-binding protein [Nitriliruptorales bacterium]
MFPRRSDNGLDHLSMEEVAELLDAARAVNGAEDLERTLSEILERAARLVQADEGSVMLLEEDDTLRIRASRGLTPDVVARTAVPLGRGISGSVAVSGRPLVLDNQADVERYGSNAERQRGLVSAICIPLRNRDAIQGVLNLNIVQGGARSKGFGPGDLQLTSLFGEFAAAAVHAFTTYEQVRRRGDDLGRLFEASHQLLGSVDIPSVSHTILDAAGSLVGAEGGFVCVPGGSGLEVTAMRDIARGRVLATVNRDGFDDLARSNSLRVVERPFDDAVLTRLTPSDDPRCAVVAPLHAQGRLQGLLVALAPPVGPDDVQLSTLTTYTANAAMALARARLFRDLRSKEEELRSLTSAVPDPVLVVGEDGTLLSLNPAASELFALHPDFEIGRTVIGRLRSEDLDAMLEARPPVRREVTLYTPDPRVFRARVAGVRPGQGPAGARILTLEDITAERDLERLKSDFVAVIGHELRTPLTLIKGYARTLGVKGDDMPEATRRQATSAISDHAERLERLIEDLLLVSRIERGRPPLSLDRTDLYAVMHQVVAEVRNRHQERRIELTADSPMPWVVDAVKVQQVLHHLLDNAIKFSDDDAPIEVSVRVEGGRAHVEVTDEGIGIFSGDTPHLFERFHQVDGTHTRARGGTGIGLYIARTLVEIHGGQIGVRSALGRGSTFWFTLPQTPPGYEEDEGRSEPSLSESSDARSS